MNDVRRYIAHASNCPEDQIEKADTALAGVAVQLLARDDVPAVAVVTTDTDAGAGVRRAVEAAGVEGQISIIDGFEFIDEITETQESRNWRSPSGNVWSPWSARPMARQSRH